MLHYNCTCSCLYQVTAISTRAEYTARCLSFRIYTYEVPGSTSMDAKVSTCRRNFPGHETRQFVLPVKRQSMPDLKGLRQDSLTGAPPMPSFRSQLPRGASAGCDRFCAGVGTNGSQRQFCTEPTSNTYGDARSTAQNKTDSSVLSSPFG